MTHSGCQRSIGIQVGHKNRCALDEHVARVAVLAEWDTCARRIQPSPTRGGVASRMMQTVFRLMREGGIHEVELDVAAMREDAIKFYSKKPDGGGSGTISYTPTLTVTDTSALAVSDPLKTIPDSKVVDLSLNISQNNNSIPLKLRLLITRSGIGQQ